jgi:hypothetical protein
MSGDRSLYLVEGCNDPTVVVVGANVAAVEEMVVFPNIPTPVEVEGC